MKTILVTGGAGFLGSHLCARLLADGNKVICLDNLQTGSERNIAALKQNPDFRFVLHDVADPLAIDEKLDRIFNLACPASPVHYQADPLKTIRTSVLGAMNMLELARAHGARIMQASTSEVYGDPDIHPQVESYHGNVNPIGIRACYDEGKRVAETLMSDYRRQHGVQVRLARIFNTYGPNMDMNDGRVVSNFIVQALSGDPITIYGSGEQTRSFCFYSDLIEGFIRLMDYEGTDAHLPVNLGNPGEFTIKELAEKVVALTDSGSELVYRDLPADDPTRRRPDITRAGECLNWRPDVKLDDGLPPTVAYFKSILTEN